MFNLFSFICKTSQGCSSLDHPSKRAADFPHACLGCESFGLFVNKNCNWQNNGYPLMGRTFFCDSRKIPNECRKKRKEKILLPRFSIFVGAFSFPQVLYSVEIALNAASIFTFNYLVPVRLLYGIFVLAEL